MAIGKYCQICGKKKRPSEVITEAHGIVVTAPCMMEKVFPDPPADPARVRAMGRFCPVCGAEQSMPMPDHCASCGAALFTEVEAEDLAKAGRKAGLRPRAVAFLFDLAVIGGLFAIALWGLARIEGLMQEPAIKAVPEEGMDLFTFIKIAAFLLIFVFYHGVFTWLFNRTPGKTLAGLKTVLKNGSSDLGFTRSITRSALYLFTLYVIPIGLIPLVFQEDRAAWVKMMEDDALFHNTLTDTEVIRPRA